MTTKTKTAAEIAQLLQGTVHGDATVALTGFAPADQARPGDLTFAENEDYFRRAEQSAASAILVSNHFPSSNKTQIEVANARVAFAKILPVFFPVVAPPAGMHPSAAIDPTAQVDPTAHIGPHCVVAAGAQIGPRAVLLAGVYVGENVQLGEDVWLFPGVTLYPRSIVGHRVRIHAGSVVGSDGFGYVFTEGRHVKVPQVGNVVIQDDVEIGANVTIDRGALGSTVIGRGSKIDNLVQIAHNVVLGEHCILVAQVGVAGSTQVGNFVTMAGQVGVAGHLKIGHQAVLGAQAGVMHNVPDKEKWLGAPAQPTGQFMRQVASLKRLPELLQKVGRLEKELAELKASLPSTTPP